tara:strand:- start:810 stop:1706 length:897 start_codon:yes stop_codon:yes gene_type:complete
VIVKDHLINLLSKSLGDTIALMPYLELYRQKYNCNVYLLGNRLFHNLFTKSYPNIIFVDDNFINSRTQPFDIILDVRYDFHNPVQQGMAKQLGFENPKYIRPKIDSFKKKRPIKNKFITFGMQSTSQLKYWNSPQGKRKQPESPYWNELCKMLRKEGITPVCLEQHELFGNSPFFNGVPKKSVKKLNLPLSEVINYIEHSEFYIGLSSGVAWIAHALNKPVAMIANFTEDWNEFDLNLKDYKRITNKNVCHGCWNSKDNIFDVSDWYWCPNHKNTSRQFECHTSITPEYVFNEIKEWI